jgi:hypothetical protein
MELLTKEQICKLWAIIERHILQITLCNNWLSSLKFKQISEVSWLERRLEVCNTMLVWVDTTMKTVNKIMTTKRSSKSEVSSVNSTTMKRPTTVMPLLTIDQ